ncbi:hypothetical protein C1H46_020863 [Malus baccata]|uniref:Uncharacterized protein n=1 Tax=Malus baccata TaxID=106549 RepID=A0A540M4B0_MALBA|nr:hypothetical protein C1H46_020863 [Malus baccata]
MGSERCPSHNLFLSNQRAHNIIKTASKSTHLCSSRYNNYSLSTSAEETNTPTPNDAAHHTTREKLQS